MWCLVRVHQPEVSVYISDLEYPPLLSSGSSVSTSATKPVLWYFFNADNDVPPLLSTFNCQRNCSTLNILHENFNEEQSEVFRMDLEECQRAYNSYAQTEDVIKASQSWMPSDTDRNAYTYPQNRGEMQDHTHIFWWVSFLEVDYAQTKWTTLCTSHIRIYITAHAILSCIISIDMQEHS